MKKGMAVALGAGVVVVAGWVGATWYAGTKIEGHIEQLLTNVNQHWASEVPMLKLRLERRDYSRGVFASQVRYAVVLEESSALLPPGFPTGSIEFDTRIEHGPFPMTRLARGALAPVLAASRSALVKTDNVAPLFALTGGVAPYTDDVQLYYDGRVESQVRIAPIQYTDANTGLTVTFSGMDVQTRGDALFVAQSAVKGEGHIDTLLFQVGERARIELSDIVLAIDNTLGKFGIMNGEVSLKAGRMDFSSPRPEGEGRVTVDDFIYRVKVDENDSALSIAAVYGAAKVTLQSPRPDVMVGDLGGGDIAVKLDNLDAAALKALQQSYLAIMQGVMGGQADVALKAEILPQLFAAGETLLANKPTVSITPRWQTGAGESTLTFSLGLTAPPDFGVMVRSGKLPDDLILQLIERIDMDLVVSKPQLESLMTQVAVQGGATPERAAGEAAQQVRALAGMAEMLNIARNDGDKLVGRFRYADRVAKLNDIEVPLHDYLPGLSDLAEAGLLGDEDGFDDEGFDFDDDDDHDHDDDDDHDHD